MTDTQKQAEIKPADDGYNKRIEELRAKRQQRGTAYTAGKNLSVDASKLDPRYEYRWVNNENVSGRQAEATFLGDWEMVPNKNGDFKDGRNVEEKSTIARLVDKDNGKRAYLMRKPKELYQDDQKAKLAPIQKQVSEMRRHGVAPSVKADEGAEASNTYTPKQVTGAYRP